MHADLGAVSAAFPIAQRVVVADHEACPENDDPDACHAETE
jgi:hypothetical protein